MAHLVTHCPSNKSSGRLILVGSFEHLENFVKEGRSHRLIGDLVLEVVVEMQCLIIFLNWYNKRLVRLGVIVVLHHREALSAPIAFAVVYGRPMLV